MTNAPEKRTIVEQALFRLAYSVGLHRGAEKIRDSTDSIALVGFSAYLLIGFAIENGLASFLIAHNHPTPGDYKSHDLNRALKPCASYGLVFGPEVVKFISLLTPMQKDFVFRYPENLDQISLPSVADACKITKEILRDIRTVFLMKGFDVGKAVESLSPA